jgi:hypothetical protein
MGQADEPRAGAPGGSGPVQETENEKRTYAELERFKGKRRVLEGPGVEIEVVV